MLYEVITFKHLNRARVKMLACDLCLFDVITSYSIHYTKLYDMNLLDEMLNRLDDTLNELAS